MQYRSPLIIAHRGASGRAPENTLAAISHALNLGVDGIELDVRLVEGVPILYHGRRLEDSTDGYGDIHQASFDNLRSLDAGGGQQIPTLCEALDLIDRRCLVNLELKGPGTGKTVARVLQHYLGQPGWYHQHFLISSFDQHELLSFNKRIPQVPLGLLFCGLPIDQAAQAGNLGAYSLHLSADFIDRKIITDAHSRGIAVYAYTVNHPDELKSLQFMGLDGIFTDYPDHFLPVRNIAQAS